MGQRHTSPRRTALIDIEVVRIRFD